MRDYIDLVLCETCTGNREIFQAPKFSHLAEGDMVIAENGDGEVMTNVIKSISIGTNDEDFDFLKAALKFELEDLNRIKSRVYYRELEYKED